MSTILSFKVIENKHDVYKGKDWMKKFSESSMETLKAFTDFKNK